MKRYVQETDVPEWMTTAKTTLIQKYPPKRTAPNNYRPITIGDMEQHKLGRIFTIQ